MQEESLSALDTEEDERRPWERMRLVLTYVIFGPPIGGVVIFAPVVLGDATIRPPIGSHLLLSWIVLSYLIGTIPAVVTGIIMSRFHREIQKKSFYVIISAIVGFFVSGLIPIIPLALAFAGAISASLIAYFEFKPSLSRTSATGL